MLSKRSILTQQVFPYILGTYIQLPRKRPAGRPSSAVQGVFQAVKNRKQRQKTAPWRAPCARRKLFMPMQDTEDQKLKAEIDEIMQRVDRILAKLDSEDPGKPSKGDASAE